MAPVQKATDWSSIDVPVKHEGKQITLPNDPAPMDYKAARQTLARIEQQENQTFDANEKVLGAPWDALVAVYRAMQRLYGVVIAESIQTFFGEIKPDMITIFTGVADHDRIQVPMGRMALPNVSEPVNIGMFEGGAFISGTVRRRDRAFLVEIANLARKLLREESVYRGQAIRLGVDDDGDLDMNRQPEFMDIRHVAEGDMIHAAETTALIRTNIFAPLKNTEACRRHRIPLKRGILLEGRYGTGKSPTARVTARVAADHGWTFITLDRVQGLKAAIEFARAYQPCVIFAEDIDRAADRDDEDVNDLVNMLDGVLTKDAEIMVVLTTNFIEKIDKALLRPGRFDAVISIQPPDAETSVRLIQTYARGLLGEGDLTQVGGVIAGWIPATIREVVERAKLSMLTDDRAQITPDDLMISAVGMKRHMELLEPKETQKSARDLFCDGLLGMLQEASTSPIAEGGPSLRDVFTLLDRVDDRVIDLGTGVERANQAARAGANSAEIGRRTSERVLEAVSKD
ncbi:ATP-binding protein [Methylobacterium ajmalii]|uniref:ATP-binding protein n=1 Tax=Methylobacterium ajmalii TaxID=2738439 RepID=A0ABV0A376_9HYPH